MRSALLLAALVGSAVAQTTASESIGLAGPLGVYLKTDHATSTAVLSAMKREVEAVLVPAGVHLVWNSQPDSEVYTRIAVMRLRGRCDLDGPVSADIRGLSRDAEPLGATYVADGRVLPFADVRCDSVRKVIDRDLRPIPANDRYELLGRALGRVMAHELYHVLLRTRDHGRSGLARPMITSSDLLAVHDNFAAPDEQKLSGALVEDAPGGNR